MAQKLIRPFFLLFSTGDFDFDSDCCGRRFMPTRQVREETIIFFPKKGNTISLFYFQTFPASPFKRHCAGAAFYARQGLSAAPTPPPPVSKGNDDDVGSPTPTQTSPAAVTPAGPVDVAPPGRVLDLRVAGPASGIARPDGEEDAPGQEDFVRLEWTAPGGDYDQGKGEGIFETRTTLTFPTFATQPTPVFACLDSIPILRRHEPISSALLLLLLFLSPLFWRTK